MYRADHASGEHTWPRLRFPRRIAAVLPLALGIALAGSASPAAVAPAEAAPAHLASILTPLRVQALADHSQAVEAIVRHGDTLSGLSKAHYGSGRYWYWLALVNHLRDGNVIQLGQHLVFPPHPRYVRPPIAVAPRAPRSNGSGTYVAASASGPWPGGAFGACVVMRESGGNAQVMNSSGHYGLYQFSASTWAAYGGSAALFGHASVAYQEQIFMNALRAGGESNWSPYDGC